MMRKRIAWIAVALVALATACGGDDGGNAGGSTEEPSAALASAVEDLSGCLTDAGLEVTVEDTKAFGVEDAHEHLEVALESEAFNEPYNVDLWVFESPEEAEAARTAITLETKDDERGKVLGNVVVNYEIVPDEEDTEQVEACLEV